MTKPSNLSIPANRFKALLQMIPRAPDSISTDRLLEKLSAAGFDVDLRTLQRDLKDLGESGEFGLGSEKKGRESARWQYLATTPVTIFPSLDDHTALAFRLADAFLQSLMPPETVKALRPFVEEAGRHLSKRRHAVAGKWQDKIHVFPQGMRRKPPKIRPEVREVVYRALLEEMPLRLMHHSRNSPVPKEFLVSPVGLVVRDYMIYLYGVTREKKQVLAFALNRTQHAEILEGSIFDKPPAGFTLAESEELVSKPYEGSRHIDLKLRIGKISAYSLREWPLPGRQSLIPDAENPEGGILTASVPNTVELRQWIRSLGPNTEVLEPTFLRSEMAEEIATLARRYGCHPGDN